MTDIREHGAGRAAEGGARRRLWQAGPLCVGDICDQLCDRHPPGGLPRVAEEDVLRT